MSDQILSGDEVDTLLAGVEDIPEPTDVDNTSETPVAADSIAGSDDDIKPFDIAKQDRILRDRMPALEKVNENFSRTFRLQFESLTGQLPTVIIGEVTVEKYDSYLASKVLPSNLNIVQVKPLRGKGLVIFEPQLIGSLVNSLFGGNGGLQNRFEGRDFSATEQRIISKLLTIFTESYALAWKGIYPIELEYVRSEMLPQFATIATPAELVITTEFRIEVNGIVGAIHLCIPYGTFEPIRETLYANPNAEHLDQDGSWINKLSAQLEQAQLEIVAQLASTELTFSDLLNLQSGDFIELDLSDELSVEIDGISFLKCRYGTNDNRYAVKVTDFLTGPEELVKGVKNG